MTSLRRWIEKVAKKLVNAANASLEASKKDDLCVSTKDCEQRRQHLADLCASIDAEIQTNLELGDKAMVQRLLCRRQMIAREIKVVDTLVLRMHELSFGIESAAAQGQALRKISQLGARSQQVYKDFNLDNVDEIMEVVQRQQSMQSRIAESLTANFTETDADLDILEMLELQLVNEKLSRMAKIPTGVTHRRRSADVPLGSTRIAADVDCA